MAEVTFRIELDDVTDDGTLIPDPRNTVMDFGPSDAAGSGFEFPLPLPVFVTNWPDHMGTGGGSPAPSGAPSAGKSAGKAAEIPTLEPLTPDFDPTKAIKSVLTGNIGGVVGELGELAGAAGPAGIALVAVDAAAKAVAKTYDYLRDQTKLLGDTVADTASNNYMGAFNEQIDSAAAQLGKIPIVGQVWASALEAGVQPIRSFSQVVDAFVARGKQIQDFSPNLTAANARTEIRDLLADVKEADQLGPGIARLTDAQDELWNEIRAILLPMKKVIVDDLAGFMEWMVEFTRSAMAEFKLFAELLDSIASAVIAFLTGDGKEAIRILGLLTPENLAMRFKQLHDQIEAEKLPDDIGGAQLRELAKNLGGIGGVGDAGLPAFGNRLNLPLAGGF